MKIVLDALSSPRLFPGDAATAYRDPAAIDHDDGQPLFSTLAET